MSFLNKSLMGVLFSCLCLIGTSQTSFAQKWTPYQFKGHEQFEFKLSWLQDIPKEVVYVMDLKETGQKDENEEEIIEVSFTVKGKINKNELSEGSMDSLMLMQGIPLNLIIFNPIYQFIFSEIDMKEGEKTHFAGMGTVKVTGKEKIAGREGLICQFYLGGENEKEQLTSEWVIDPKLGLPLRSKTFEENTLQYQCELIKYSN